MMPESEESQPLQMERVIGPIQEGNVDCAMFALLYAQRIADASGDPTNFSQVSCSKW